MLPTRLYRTGYAGYAVCCAVVLCLGWVGVKHSQNIASVAQSAKDCQNIVEEQAKEMEVLGMENKKCKLKEDKMEKECNILREECDKVKRMSVKEECNKERRNLEDQVSELKETLSKLEEQHRKLENDFSTFQKANSEAIADTKTVKTENRKMRKQIHDAAAELIRMGEGIKKISAGRLEVSGNKSKTFCLFVTVFLYSFHMVKPTKSNHNYWREFFGGSDRFCYVCT